MIPQRSPLIQAGQTYLNEELDEYLIVLRNNRGCVYYAGDGFKGHTDDWSFIEKFPPVDPDDIDPDELQGLIEQCPEGTEAKIGFIMEELDEEEELA